MKKIALAAGAVALMSAPVVAQSVPTTAPVSEENKLSGGLGVFAGILGAAIIALGILTATGNDDDLPTSP